MKLISSALVLLFLSSCSTSWSDLFEDENSEKRNKKLMKSFGAEEEVLKKFTEKKDSASQDEPNKNLSENKKESSKKSAKKAKPQKPKAKKKVVVIQPSDKRGGGPVVIPPKVKETSERPKLTQPKEFPEDYPEELKKISRKAKELWTLYDPRFFPGETIVMDINYMGISTGKIVLDTKEDTVIGEQEVYHAGARVKTSDYYRYLYELDDNIDSYVSKTKHVPVKFSMIQRESGKDVDDLQLFDLEALTTYSFYQRVKDGKVKKKKTEEPVPLRFTDPLYVIWFLRGLPMDEGKTFTVPIMNRGKVILLTTENQGVETIDTPMGKKKAFRMKASTAYTGETLKSGAMTFWFSADEKRVFLKFNAKIKIGSISGVIEKYRP